VAALLSLFGSHHQEIRSAATPAPTPGYLRARSERFGNSEPTTKSNVDEPNGAAQDRWLRLESDLQVASTASGARVQGACRQRYDEAFRRCGLRSEQAARVATLLAEQLIAQHDALEVASSLGIRTEAKLEAVVRGAAATLEAELSDLLGEDGYRRLKDEMAIADEMGGMSDVRERFVDAGLPLDDWQIYRLARIRHFETAEREKVSDVRSVLSAEQSLIYYGFEQSRRHAQEENGGTMVGRRRH
jgi:hypothetical protein